MGAASRIPHLKILAMGLIPLSLFKQNIVLFIFYKFMEAWPPHQSATCGCEEDQVRLSGIFSRWFPGISDGEN